jgi:acylphosphatase
MQRLSVFYIGRVQGVGFRATCVRLAKDFKVTGRVCNLTDGRVEMVAEGERQELVRFRDRIAIEMQRNIASTQESWSAASNGWTCFDAAADKQV